MSIDWNRVITVSDDDTAQVIAGKAILYVQNGEGGGGGGGGVPEWGDIAGTLSNQTDLKNALDDKLNASSLVWGNIGGTISNQTDLDTALNAKADYSSLDDMAFVADAPSDSKTYGRKNGAWAEVTGGSGGGVWGSITGTLSNQTDLNSALIAKPDWSELGAMAEVADAPSDGNNYARKSGTWSKLKPEGYLSIRKLYSFEKGQDAILPAGSDVVAIKCEFGIYQTGSGNPSSSNIRPFVGFSSWHNKVYDGTTVVQNSSAAIQRSGQSITVYGGYWWSDDYYYICPYGHIASYNGETLSGRWWSDRDVYLSGTTPTTGAEVVYELSTPETYTVGLQTWATTTQQMKITLTRGWDNTMTPEDSLSASVAVDTDMSEALGDIIAPAFDPTQSYAIGDYVTYNCGLFMFTAPHSAGIWDEQHVIQTTVMAELKRLTS